MHHLDSHDILHYLKGEQVADARERFVDHIRSCEECRSRVEEEGRLDQLLRHRLPYHRARAALIQRIRDGLQQVASQEARRRVPAAWISSWAAATAAAVALLLVLAPAQPGALYYEGLVTGGPVSGILRNIRGALVCVGCARHGLDIETQKRCTPGQEEGHVTGLLDTDGHLWRFMKNREVATFMGDPLLRGRQVEVSARPFSNIDYLRVYAVESL